MPDTATVTHSLIFEFVHGGAKRGRQVGVNGSVAVEGAGELWTIAVASLNYKPEVGSTFKPHDAVGSDSRKRTVTAVAKDAANWLLTCTVAT